MASFDPDVYLLDAANNKIWRYAGAAGGSSQTPTSFFASPSTKLNSPISLALDDTSVYALQSDGTVQKFDNQGNAQKFSMNLRVPLKNPVSIFTDAGLNYVWIADPGNQRIVQVDKNGNYVRSYAASTKAMDFSRLRTVSVFSKGSTIYVLAGTKIFDFPLAP